MKLVAGIFLLCICLAFGEEHGHRDSQQKEQAAPTDPVVGHWNVSYDGKHGLCIRMDAGIRLDIEYETKDQATNKSTATIVSLGMEDASSVGTCKNASLDLNQTLQLDFGPFRKLYFNFTRDEKITGDKNEQKWQLYAVEFDFLYDRETFPHAKDPIEPQHRSNKDPLKVVLSSNGKSYGCSKTDAMKVTDDFTVTLTGLRVQPFMTTDEFGQADWCSKDETSDLIPIIIGAALAALVIIVLIAYLVGRARARTTTYDNI